MMYPSMWPIFHGDPEHQLLTEQIDANDQKRMTQRAKVYAETQTEAQKWVKDFHDKLVSGDLTAFGWSERGSQTITKIAKEEWNSLIIDPPQAYRTNNDKKRVFPWLDIHFERDAVQILWPGPIKPEQIKLSPRKDWAAISRVLHEFNNSQTVDCGMPDRKLADHVLRKVRGAIEPDLIPADRTLREYISNCREAGTLPPRHNK